MTPEGLVASVRQRLLNLLRQRGETFDYVLARYPIGRAARTAVDTVRRTLERIEASLEVIFRCFSTRDLEIYRTLLATGAAGLGRHED